MPEGLIDSLPTKDFSVKPRRVYSFQGENAGIRVILTNDREDAQRWREMDHILGSMGEIIGKPLADSSIIKEIRQTQPGKTTKRTDRYMFGVAGTENAPEVQKGELQGVIGVYPNAEAAVLVGKGFLPENSANEKVFEVTVVKKPRLRRHQVSSALRQVVAHISEIDAVQYPDSLGPKTIITANVAKNGKGEASRKVLLAAGFEKQGSTDYDGDTMYDFYVLNWEKLHKIMHEKADAVLSDKELVFVKP